MPSGNAECLQNVSIGGILLFIPAMVNTTIVPTCFSCLDFNNLPVESPIFMINGILVTLDIDVMIIGHQLIVENFTSLPLLLDGVINMFSCENGSSIPFFRNLTTLSKKGLLCCTDNICINNLAILYRPVPLSLPLHTHTIIVAYPLSPLHLSSALCLNKDPIPPDLSQFKDFYVEGDELDITCSNNNVAPYLGGTVWTDSMDNPVGNGGSLQFTANRIQAGIYTCNVELLDPSAMVAIPPRFFTLVVQCKLCN